MLAVPPIVLVAVPVNETVPKVLFIVPPLLVQFPFTVIVPAPVLVIVPPALRVILPALLSVTVPVLILNTPLLLIVISPGKPVVPTVNVRMPTLRVAVALAVSESMKVIVRATLAADNTGWFAARGIRTLCAVVGTKLRDQFEAVLHAVEVVPFHILSNCA